MCRVKIKIKSNFDEDDTYLLTLPSLELHFCHFCSYPLWHMWNGKGQSKLDEQNYMLEQKRLT